ncbi:MAG: hypothetical protein K6T72_06440 [Anoxybacillus sp.]|nr:hypothetical protein [Anoxybacillus sp.]
MCPVRFRLRKAQSARLSAKSAQAPPRRLSNQARLGSAWVSSMKPINAPTKEGAEHTTPMALEARQRSI